MIHKSQVTLLKSNIHSVSFLFSKAKLYLMLHLQCRHACIFYTGSCVHVDIDFKPSKITSLVKHGQSYVYKKKRMLSFTVPKFHHGNLLKNNKKSSSTKTFSQDFFSPTYFTAMFCASIQKPFCTRYRFMRIIQSQTCTQLFMKSRNCTTIR